MATSGWVITGQVTDQVRNTQAGQTVTGVVVYFITGDGNEGSVFIDNARYNQQNVFTAVHDQAALIDGVGKLSEGPTGD